MARNKTENTVKDAAKEKEQAKESVQMEEAGKQPLPMKFDVRIHSIIPEGTIKATASVNINDAFAVKGLRVVHGSKGLFVAMPSFKSGDGFKDICFPVTTECRENLQKAVIGAYEQAIVMGQNNVQEQHEMKHQAAPGGQAPKGKTLEMAGI